MATFNLTTATNLFKTNYVRLSENTYNSANVLLGRVKKSYNFTGNQLYIAVPLSFQGGVGSGSLPTSAVADYEDAIITAKKVYSVVLIDREAIKASANDQGAFVRGLKEVVRKGVESYMRNASRILFGTGDGALGVISSVVDTDPTFVLTFNAGTFNEANFEENDRVNIETANTDPFDITIVAPQTDDTLDVTVVRASGTQVPVATDEVFMQNQRGSMGERSLIANWGKTVDAANANTVVKQGLTSLAHRNAYGMKPETEYKSARVPGNSKELMIYAELTGTLN